VAWWCEFAVSSCWKEEDILLHSTGKFCPYLMSWSLLQSLLLRNSPHVSINLLRYREVFMFQKQLK